jgi:uncharacterized membrane protein
MNQMPMARTRGALGQAWIQVACPFVFLVLALSSGLFQAWALPPFMGPDELAHTQRVDQITFGHLVGQRYPDGARMRSGGATDWSLRQAADVFDSIRFDQRERADAAEYAAAAVTWDGRTGLDAFPGSAIYPPFFYLPAAAGLALGKLLGLPVVQSLYLARFGNVLACTLVGFAALAIAGRIRLLVFALLMLPMSVALYASVTADGLLIATTALGCAILSRAVNQGRPLERREVIAAAACFALVGMTKSPYALLAALLLAVPARRSRWRYAAAAAVVALALAWNLWMAAAVQTAISPPGGGANAGAQLGWLLGDPGRVAAVAAATLRQNLANYVDSFVGVLGWLDTPLPGPYYPAARVMLVVAAALSVSVGRASGTRALWFVAVVVGVALFGAVHAAMYLAWTKVGALVVQGVQGRYLIPIALVLGLALEGERAPALARLAPPWLVRVVLVALLAFPVLSGLMVQHAIITRYYLD